MSHRVTLEVTSGTRKGYRVWILEAQSVRIGRTEASDHSFPADLEISNQHFEISCRHGICRLRDLKSANGTYVNGARIETAILAHGDVIRSGRTEFRVAVDKARPASGLIHDAAREGEDQQDERAPIATASPAEQAIAVSVTVDDSHPFEISPHRRVIVGRNPSMDISVPTDRHLSGRHFSLENTGTKVIVRDEGSTNGTFIGPSRISEQVLEQDTEIRAGHSRFTVRIADRRVAAEAPVVEPAPESSKQADEAATGRNEPVRQPAVHRHIEHDNEPPVASQGPGEITKVDQPPSPATGSTHPPLEIVILDYQHADSTPAKLWLVPPQTVSVGRTEEADEAIEDDHELSARHFIIIATEEGCRLVDLGTTNGTYINGVRVDEAPLIDGDVVTAGRTTFRVQVVGGPDKVDRVLSSRAARRDGIPRCGPKPLPVDGRAGVTGPLIACEAFPCGSGLVLYRGVSSAFDPAETLRRLAFGCEICIYHLGSAEADAWVPWQKIEQSDRVKDMWRTNAAIAFGAPKSTAWQQAIEPLATFVSPGGEQILSSSAAIADFLANSAKDIVQEMMHPFDFVLVDIHAGERWGLFTFDNSRAWISSYGFNVILP
jgi:pSer/pThr/pTyr-binding forkhead associated (FHA) protein